MAVSHKRASNWRGRFLTVALFLGSVALIPVGIALAKGRPLAQAYDFVGPVFAAEPEAPNLAPPGTVRVLVSGRKIPAYSKLTRDDLWNAKVGTWAYMDVDESLVDSAGILVSAADIVGRVMGQVKRPGYVFTESDFLPKGTRPGFSAGIPAGKRALRVEVDRVQGIVGLLPGDRFDIVSAIETEPTTPDPKGIYSGPYTGRMTSAAKNPNGPSARVRALVQNGVVVTSLETRAVPITTGSLTSGRVTKTIPVQEMVIAMDPEEIAPFMEALSIEADLQCLARSGRPDDPLDSVTPSSEPRSSGLHWNGLGAAGSPHEGGTGGELSVVESIDDLGRTLVPVPRGNSRSGTNQ